MGKLTNFRVERNGNIVVLDRVLWHVQANKVGSRVLVLLGKRELSIDNANTKLARTTKGLDVIGSLENKVHASSMLEVGEEGDHLGDSILFDNLHSGQVGLPFLVDGNDTATAGDGKARGSS